jgi:hypothetical protein
MAFELNLFGTPVQFGSFDFFDLMDENPAAQASAQVVAFQAKATPVHAANDGDHVKTAA